MRSVRLDSRESCLRIPRLRYNLYHCRGPGKAGGEHQALHRRGQQLYEYSSDRYDYMDA